MGKLFTERNGAGHHFHIVVFLKRKEESNHICIFKGVKFLTFLTCALPLVAVSEMLCDYRNSLPPLRNVSAEEDFRDFFYR